MIYTMRNKQDRTTVTEVPEGDLDKYDKRLWDIVPEETSDIPIATMPVLRSEGLEVVTVNTLSDLIGYRVSIAGTFTHGDVTVCNNARFEG